MADQSGLFMDSPWRNTIEYAMATTSPSCPSRLESDQVQWWCGENCGICVALRCVRLSTAPRTGGKLLSTADFRPVLQNALAYERFAPAHGFWWGCVRSKANISKIGMFIMLHASNR